MSSFGAQGTRLRLNMTVKLKVYPVEIPYLAQNVYLGLHVRHGLRVFLVRNVCLARNAYLAGDG